ncbi:response regulator [Mucilaginibacter sp. S1162]|uniref:Response regulator n=1 Tax=Mucilaginibacter humi TaxID=2732510 RepID=A0ABX1W5Q5_9SPHI|nr:response regulator [Mucilaginibacter humi]NNU33382.1 response regulator [Mucilaginibacter humi]
MRTILLIEDNNDIRENTCELLELEGYKVIPALNGKTGLTTAFEHLPDLILCDIMMPEVNGYEVFVGLQADPATRAIPFIFLTASAENKEVAVGRRWVPAAISASRLTLKSFLKSLGSR